MNDKTLEYYLTLPYTIELSYSSDEGWFARVRELPGCMAQADTAGETVELIQEAMELWLEDALEDGLNIPEPRPVAEYSGKFVVRVPRSLHRDLAERANEEGVSLNQYMNVALAGAVGGARTVQISTTAAADDPYWPGLKASVRQVLVAAGMEDQAGELDERLFASWVEQNLIQVESAVQSGYARDALHYLESMANSLHNAARRSPVLAVFQRLTKLLWEQTEALLQLQQGVLNDMAMRSRIDVYAQRSNQAMAQQIIREERAAYSVSSTRAASAESYQHRTGIAYQKPLEEW